MCRRRSRRGDVSQVDLILNVVKRLMVVLERRWRQRFTRPLVKSARAGNESTTKLHHCELASMVAKIALKALSDGVKSPRSESVSTTISRSH